MESLQPSEVRLYAAGVPVPDESLVSAFETTDLELTVGLLGGKVHGSLARAGMYCVYMSHMYIYYFLRQNYK